MAADPAVRAYDEVLVPVPVPADRSVRLDEPPAVAVDRRPAGREPSAARTIGPMVMTLQRRPAAPIGGEGKGIGKQSPERWPRLSRPRLCWPGIGG